MQALWSVSQIQGKRDYQEDVFAAVESDCIFYAGEQYPLENGVLPAQYTLLVIADGMGGMGHGDIAASIIVESFIECFLNVFNQKNSMEARFSEALESANTAVADKIRENAEFDGMGATLIAVLWDAQDNKAYWVSVGDSLLLASTASRPLLQVNEKHTWGMQAEALRARGNTLPDDVLQKRFHALCSAVDGQPMAFVDLQTEGCHLTDGDFLVLASDGVESLDSDVLQESVQAARRSFMQYETLKEQSDSLAACTLALLEDTENSGNEYQDNTTVALLGVTKVTTVS